MREPRVSDFKGSGAMRISFVVRAGVVLASMTAMPAMAFAQAAWTPGSEVVGHPVQVTTNGVTNTVYLDNGGTARIMTPSGNTIPASWTAANSQLCLTKAGAQECWPYSAPFHAGTPVTLTSSCNATSTWLAASTNAPPPVERGERGR
jgi:hypothetical protein